MLCFLPASHMDTDNSPARTPFPLGQTLATPGALRELTADDVLTGLKRHMTGDWGDLGKEDIAANNAALRNGDRLVSAYRSSTGVKFYVITEWDRSATTVLLPHEY